MGRRIIDISVPLTAGIASDPPQLAPQIEYLDHHATAPGIASFFGVPVDALPDGEYCAIERCAISTHNGTHLDAPYHFFSSMNHRLKAGGEPSMRIDEVPLEWCFQPGVKLDFRHFEDGYVATPTDVEAELKRIGHKLRPLEIVVVNTRAGTRYGEEDYIDAGCGLGKAATLWMLERGVRLVGTDGWSWDAPFSHTRRKVEA
ncbi:MAG: cyclase family protein, partial [Hyphomicrobiales bacterium]|nr:cyclase family protein [Hyphomicrobiales bacterium]